MHNITWWYSVFSIKLTLKLKSTVLISTCSGSCLLTSIHRFLVNRRLDPYKRSPPSHNFKASSRQIAHERDRPPLKSCIDYFTAIIGFTASNRFEMDHEYEIGKNRNHDIGGNWMGSYFILSILQAANLSLANEIEPSATRRRRKHTHPLCSVLKCWLFSGLPWSFA